MNPETKGPLEPLLHVEPALAVPFHVFVLVCDQSRGITSRAAIRFQQVLAGRRHGMSRLCREMLDFCRENYQALWRDYAGSKLTIDRDGFADLLESLRSEVTPAEYGELEHDLERLARTLFRAGFVFYPRHAQKEAFAAFVRTLRQREPSSRPRDRHTRTGAPAGAIQAPSGGLIPQEPARTDGSSAEGSRGEEIDSPNQPRASVPASLLSPGAGSNAGSKMSMPVLRGPNAAWGNSPLSLICVKVTEEARQVKTFSFTSGERNWFLYQPGQFMTIEPVVGGRAVPRSYTIASTPTRPGLLEITVKRVPGGVVSNWLHDNMRVGKELSVRGPFGKFSCLNYPREKYLFLSAGSGITPVMSMFRYLYDLAAPVDVVFFHSAATEQDIVFRQELGLCAERDPHLRVFVSLTGDPAGDNWQGLRGRLDNEMLHRIAPDFMERMVLACGPGGFMDKAKQLLAGNDFPLATQFDEESFVPRRTRQADGRTRERTGEKRKVVFVKSCKALEITSEETILEAAERCGIEIPSSCRQGRCGTCRATKLSGDVIMPGQEALSSDELAGGEILTCVGQPNSSLVEVDL